MKFLNLASNASVWRGLEYYQQGKVITNSPMSSSVFEGLVDGSAEEPYQVRIDIEHPRSSICDCPHAKDKIVICKHKVALFFEVFPEAVDLFLREVEENVKEYQLLCEKWEADRRREVTEYVYGLPEEKVREELIYALLELQDLPQDRWC